METFGPLKGMAETAAMAAMPNRVLAIRMGLLAGPGDPYAVFTYWPVRVARGGTVLAPGSAGDPVQFIDVRDVARFTVAMIERGETGAFNTTGPARPYTMGELLAECRKQDGAGAELVWLPEQFLRENDVHPWVGLPVWAGRQGGSAGLATRRIDRALGKGLMVRPVGETVRDTLVAWRLQPPERKTPLAGLSSEREEALLSAWKKRATAQVGMPRRGPP
jgi:2'-hydroxyisoflavone reductase